MPGVSYELISIPKSPVGFLAERDGTILRRCKCHNRFVFMCPRYKAWKGMHNWLREREVIALDMGYVAIFP